MSMLKYYFDCSQKDNKELFEGLKIMEQGEEYTSKLGYYPCIYLTLKDLVTLKLDEFEQKFKVLVRQMFSFMDVGENTAENFYHAFVLGMLVGLKDSYYVNSNRESGYGRYDIMLEPKDKKGNSFIMEFKVYREEKEKEEEKRRLEARQERETLNAGYRRYEELRYGTSATSNKETKEEPKPRDTRTSETPKEPSEYRQNIYNKPVASKEPVKKFTPSPVISPVYGVLDKNYRKEDILPRASSEGTLPKIMDVDNVRKKAFGFLEKNIDTEENEPLKDFQGENEMQMADISKELDVDEEIGKTTRIDISDVKEVEEDIKAKEEEPKEPTVKSNKNDEEDSLEKDLFNLIDSMYESREDK